jgi:hypothetical protein
VSGYGEYRHIGDKSPAIWPCTQSTTSTRSTYLARAPESLDSLSLTSSPAANCEP